MLQPPKNKKNKKSIKDIFAFGGTAMNIDNPSESLAKSQRIGQDAYMGSMLDPTAMGLGILGNFLSGTGMGMVSQGLTTGGGGSSKFGQFLSKNASTINSMIGLGQASTGFASGGTVKDKKVPINAEGGEVVETPGGQPQELQGASHSQGGINMIVPNGTEIYSDRLVGADGKTMADRKKSRENQINKIQKLLQKNPNDEALKRL